MEGIVHVGLTVSMDILSTRRGQKESRKIKVGCHWIVESIMVYLSGGVLS